MIIPGTKINIIDNSGVLEGRCFKVLWPTATGGRHKGKLAVAHIGGLIMISVTKIALGNKKIKKGDIYKAVVVRTKTSHRPGGGAGINWDLNAGVLATTNVKNHTIFSPIGTRIKGPITSMRRWPGCEKIIALARLISI